MPDILATGEVEPRLTQAGAKLRLDPFLDSGRWPNIYNHIEPYRRRLSWTGGGVESGLYTLPNFNRFTATLQLWQVRIGEQASLFKSVYLNGMASLIYQT